MKNFSRKSRLFRALGTSARPRHSSLSNVRAKARVRKPDLWFEDLEARQLLAVVTWDGGAGTLNWADAANWSGDVLPTSSDDVVIQNLLGDVTIQSSETVDIRSLSSQESLSVSAGSFTLNNASAASSIAGKLWLSDGTITVNGGLKVGSFEQSGGTFTGDGNLTVTGSTTWYSGTMSGAGTTTASGGLTINGGYWNRDHYLVGRSLINLESATINDYYLQARDGATIRNAQGATWEFIGDAEVRQDGGAESRFVNEGTVLKSGGDGWATFNIAFDNKGAVSVASGGLSLNRGGTASAGSTITVTNSALGGVGLSGGYVMGNGSSLSQTGPGRVYLDSAEIHGTYSATATQANSGTSTFHDDANVLALGADLALSNGGIVLESTAGMASVLYLYISNGTLTLPSGADWSITSLYLNGAITGSQWDLDVSGSILWDGGTMSGAGTTTASGGLTINGGYWNRDHYLVGRSLVNLASATINDYYLQARDGATIQNAQGATWEFIGDAEVRQDGGAESRFVNEGTVLKSGGDGWATFNIAFDNKGAVNVTSGGLSFNRGGTASAASSIAITNSALGGVGLAGGYVMATGSSLSQTGPGRVYLDSAEIHGTYSATATQANSGTSTFHDDANVLTFGSSLTLNNGSIVLESTAGMSSVRDLSVYNATLTLPFGADWSIDSLYLNGAIVGSQWDLNVSGSIQWDGGTMSGAGTTTASGGLTINGGYWNRDHYLVGRSLVNLAAATINDYYLQARDGAIIQNAQGATWEFVGNAEVRQDGGAESRFVNEGTVLKSGGDGWATFNIAVDNKGAVSVTSGGLSLNRGGTASAGSSIAVTSSALGGVGLAGGYVMATGSSLSQAGPGRVYLDSAEIHGTYSATATQANSGTNTFHDDANVLTFGSSLTLNNGGIVLESTAGMSSVRDLSVYNATLTLPSGADWSIDSLYLNGTIEGSQWDLNVSGSILWDGGTMSGAGTTTASGGLTINGGYWNRDHYLVGRSLINLATATINDYYLQARDGAIIQNAQGATWEFIGNAEVRQDVGAESRFVNEGTVLKSGGDGWATFNIAFDNKGAVSVTSGGLSLNRGGTASAASSITVSNSALGGVGLADGYVMATGSSLSQTGPGRVYLDSAEIHGTYSATATQANSGTNTFHDDANILALGSSLTLSNGSIVLESTAGMSSVRDLSVYNATLTLPSGANWSIDSLYLNGTITGSQWDLDVSGSILWDGGTMSGAGTTTASGGLTINGGYWNRDHYLVGRSLINLATATINDYYLQARDGASIQNAQGATWEFIGNAEVRQDGGAESRFVNEGTVLKSGGDGWATFNIAVENHGSIDVQAGNLAFNRSALDFNGGSGLTVAPNSIVWVNGSLLGATIDPLNFAPDGTTVLTGGSAAAPNVLEVMGRDLGPFYTGFYENFSFGTLQFDNAYYQLVDRADNSAGSGSEAIYVDTLIVPAGSTLDLNGYRLYARVAQIGGTILGGTVNILPSIGSFETTTVLGSSRPSSTYGDSVNFTATVTAASSSAGTPIGSVQFVVDGVNFGAPVPLLNGVATSPSLASLGAGSHTVSAIYSGKYLFGTSTAINFSQSVVKAKLTIKVDDASKVASDPNPVFTASYIGLVNGDGAWSLSSLPVLSTNATASSPAGQYAITAAGAAGANYDIAYQAGTLTVASNTVVTTTTVQSSSATPIYGDSLTFTATVSSSSATPTGAVQFLVDGINFGSSVALVNGVATSLPIASLGAGAHSISVEYLGDSYFDASTATPLSISVAKKSLIIKVNDATKVYGQDNPTFSASYNGFVNGNSPATLTTLPTFNTAATTASGVGTYSITAGGASAANYVVSYEAGALAISRATLTVKADNQTKIYGQENPTLTVSYTGFVNGDTAASLTSLPTAATTATTASPAGSYNITASGGSSNNYAIVFQPGTLTVTKAVLTIKANNASRTYGQDNPTFSASYNGFVNGDTPASLAGLPILSAAVNASSPVGTYAITASGAVSNNYAITYQDGLLGITKAALTVTASNQSILTGSAIPPLTYTITGFVNGETVSVVQGAASLSTAATALSPAGSYAITVEAGSLSSANYEFTTLIPGSLTLRPRTNAENLLTLTLDRSSVTEGSAITATLTRNWVSAEPLTVNLSYSSLYPQNPQIDLPVTVTIPAGQASTIFTIATVNDEVAEKDEAIVILASAADFTGATASVIVVDDDVPVLSIEPANTSVYENGGAITFVVRRQTVTNQPLTVRLSTSNDALAAVTATVTIPAGQAMATFTLTPVDNTSADGNRLLSVTAKGVYPLCGCTIQTGWGTTGVTVIDDDLPALTLTIDQATAAEGIAAAFTATVSRNTDISLPLVVHLSSNKPGEAIPPTTVTIPAGQRSVSFSIATVDDAIVDGDQAVQITASSDGFASSSRSVTVLDASIPDLVLDSSGIELVSSAVTGQTVSIRWTVRNTGNAATSGIWYDRIYLSTDDVLDSGDTVLATIAIDFSASPLMVGGSYTGSGTLVMPSTPGAYHVFVKADYSSTIPEGSTANNTAMKSISVAPSYRATVSTNSTVVPNGTPVVLTGSAIDVLTGLPVPNKQVSVRVLVNGTRRVLNAITNASGNYSVTFRPLQTEAGRYEVAAASPQVTEDVVQAGFSIVGMGSSEQTISPRLVPNVPYTGTLTISNLGGVPLTGLSATILGAPSNIVVAPSIASSLPADGVLTLNYSLTALDASNLRAQIMIRLRSAEGATLDVLFDTTVVPLTSVLVSESGVLNEGVVAGQQKLVSFTVRNIGGAGTGPLTVQLPSIPWLRLASPSAIPSLAPGEQATVSVLLAPGADAAMQLFTGSLVVTGAAGSASTGFSFRVVSQAKGNMTVNVTDDFTYFANGAPRVGGAVVKLLDPYDNSIVIAQTVSAANGTATFNDIPAGSYLLEVTAEKHDQYRTTQPIVAGHSTSLEAFIRRQTVTYTWKVTPTDIQDQYTVHLDTTFETNVPAPVVTMEAPDVLPDIAPGGYGQFDVTFTNHGLIAAEDLQLVLPSHPDYDFTALATMLGTLPAMSSITVPVLVHRKDGMASLISARTMAAADAPSGDCALYLGSIYRYKCGPNGVLVRNGQFMAFTYTICGPSSLISGFAGFMGRVGGWPGGGWGGGGWGLSVPLPSISQVVCAPCLIEVISVVKDVIFLYLPINPDPPFWREMAACLISETSFLSSLTKKNPGDSGIKGARFAFNCLRRFATGFPGGPGRVLQIIELIRDVRKTIDCFNAPGGPGGGGGNGGGPKLMLARAIQSMGFGADLEAAVGDLFDAADNLESIMAVYQEFIPEAWLRFDDSNPSNGSALEAWIDAFMLLTDDASTSGTVIDDEERAILMSAALPANITPEMVSSYIDRWNRTLDYWSRDIVDVADVPEGESTDFLDLFSLRDKLAAMNDAIASYEGAGFSDPLSPILAAAQTIDAMTSGQVGTCATVVIRVDQDAVTTREAFNGTLEISNGNATTPLRDLELSIKITDAAGNDVTSLFGIKAPVLTGISAVDGTGIIDAGGIGTASFTIVPTRDAATDGPTVYYIGGTLGYTDPDTGFYVTRKLFPSAITVNPGAILNLDYFQQRDVIGDDPFTPEIEPSEAFDLGLIVTNTGQGTAGNFTITSAQPRIIENEKGLLIDFQIIGSQVGPQPSTTSLTLNLGDIGPGQSRTGLWHLTSTLQGRFIDYVASFEQADDFGNPRTSLIDRVTIHELIHTVLDTRPGADLSPDFLVNDDFDANALPDMLYLSDGTKAPVSIASNVTVDHAVTRESRVVQLTATMSNGWSFIRLPDPGAGYKLASVVRSDGTVIRLGSNAWQTTKVFAEGSRAYLDMPRLNLLDYNGTGSYTLTYVLDDSTPPQVTSIDAVSPDPRSAPVEGVIVHLSEAVDLATFDWNDITLTRNGETVPLSSAVSVTLVAGTDSTYAISGLVGFTSAFGAYELTVDGSGIMDFGANAGIGVKSATWSNGNAPAFVKEVGPVSAHRSSPFDSIDVTFSKPIDLASFNSADLTLTRDGATVVLPGTVAITDLGGGVYRITGLSSAMSADGSYVFMVNAAGVLDSFGESGLGMSSASWAMDTVAPQVTSVETLVTNPRNIVVQNLDVTFSEPIDLATFDRSDLVLTRNGLPVAMDNRVTIEAVTGSMYRIKGLNWFVGQQGTYVLTVAGAGVADLAANVGTGSASTSWLMDTTDPTSAVSALPDVVSTVDVSVSWSGHDNTGGSEIAFYTIYVSTDGGAFQAWQTRTTATSATYRGVYGHTYSFYSVAIDAAGNVEDTPTAPQAITRLVAPTSTAVSSSLAAPSYGNSLTFTATVSSAAGTPMGTIQFYIDGATFGPPVTLVNGVAVSGAIASLGAGAHSVTASFTGDAAYPASNGGLSISVAKARLTVAAESKEMGRGNAVPPLTYRVDGFVNGETAAVVSGAPTLATQSTSSSPVGNYEISIAPGSLTASNYEFELVPGTLTVRPKVVDIRVSWGGQSMSILNLKRSLPFSTIKAIDVIFSDDVAVDRDDFSLTSTLTAGKSYSPNGFAYDATTRTGRWTFADTLDIDKLRLALDGDAAGNDGIHTAGGVYLGAYSFGFSVLPGDINGDNRVDILDQAAARNGMLGVLDSALALWADVDGDGLITINDYTAAKKSNGKKL